MTLWTLENAIAELDAARRSCEIAKEACVRAIGHILSADAEKSALERRLGGA